MADYFYSFEYLAFACAPRYGSGFLADTLLALRDEENR